MNEQDYTRPILWSIRGLVANKKIQIDELVALDVPTDDIAHKFYWLLIFEHEKDLKHLQKAEKHISKYLDSLAQNPAK